MNQKAINDNEDLLTTVEVARLLSLSVSRIRYEVYVNRIPYLKIGRSIRFSRKQIEIWISTMQIAPKAIQAIKVEGVRYEL